MVLETEFGTRGVTGEIKSLDGAKVSETADSRVYFVITQGGEEGVSGGVVCGVVGECEIRTKHGRAQCSII